MANVLNRINKWSGLTKTTRFKIYKPAQANENIFIKNHVQTTVINDNRLHQV